MTRRPGVTLVEVLVAIAITGIGLLALLTLFPLGALEMAQSIEDDRAGHIKHSANAVANTWAISTDGFVTTAMHTPGGGLPPLNPNNPNTRTIPSYPVFVDPIGWWANASNANWQNWMAGQPGLLPRRVTYTVLSLASPDIPFATNTPPSYRQQQLLRWNTFLDDMTFPRDDPSGIPEGRPCLPVNQSQVDRAPRYSWAYLMRQLKIGSKPPPVETWVVIYKGRVLGATGTGEQAYNAVFGANGPNVITLTWGAGTLNANQPDVVPGRWIFDGTMQPDPHGYFYRVLSVTVTGANTMDVEVQTALRGGGTGVAVVMDNVIGAYQRP